MELKLMWLKIVKIQFSFFSKIKYFLHWYRDFRSHELVYKAKVTQPSNIFVVKLSSTYYLWVEFNRCVPLHCPKRSN